MAGKFLKRNAIVNTVKGEHCANAVRKRKGLTRHPILAASCGCPDPNCGAFHIILKGRTIPTSEEADALLAKANKVRKAARPKKKPKKA
jgi:hypothetical protein